MQGWGAQKALQSHGSVKVNERLSPGAGGIDNAFDERDLMHHRIVSDPGDSGFRPQALLRRATSHDAIWFAGDTDQG
jgi:hypothetical protein